jgi:acyl-CoA synthetase (AMP-forming)/AMP-acid ligase II
VKPTRRFFTAKIYQVIENRARRFPHSAAILAPECTPVTYARLFVQAHVVVTYLDALGVHRDDKVAIVLPNRPQMAVVFLSIACGAAHLAGPLLAGIEMHTTNRMAHC